MQCFCNHERTVSRAHIYPPRLASPARCLDTGPRHDQDPKSPCSLTSLASHPPSIHATPLESLALPIITPIPTRRISKQRLCIRTTRRSTADNRVVAAELLALTILLGLLALSEGTSARRRAAGPHGSGTCDLALGTLLGRGAEVCAAGAGRGGG
ncbi:uncharacterized protein M421DRAFT_343822 [Didymella exigua CBS 183.55]|uniref:Uncharacterized protein n=1 Tax=Didymella exigua CBS 183.55 TaxID=1150837 RepID=A0A6A5RWE0_9PLEO|nr:uncharacterized protein M421DRAFT_343822 [Didymella exigua CBS 183.55]KAF1931318.1 hypothetical protein M421DRAFT_343822 [Didymella exigua CBS 183.55]